MRPMYGCTLGALLVIWLAPPVDAQDNSRLGQPEMQSTAAGHTDGQGAARQQVDG